ncbi:hypothetical protein O181_117037 [Austropuccinia psidii MF-1]|uniref:Uncharacterized protein n=1 Tax=Austropuccinia psidii MF-1 TaxID=1389203 RepID=A0A9Q3KCL1_9BASI|nr:hypothetical protein [Austropuccinia psidii MF-1]
MTPTRSGSNYSIQSNGSGPGHSSHKSKRQECQPRGEAQMEDARTSTSSQRLASTFEPLIESPEADITAIAVRPESFPTGSSGDLPVSVQELVYGRQTARVGTSPKSLDRHHELLSSSEEVHGARKDRRSSEGLDTNDLQRTSPTYKSLVEKPKHVIRGSEEEAGPRQGKQPSGSSPSIHQQKSTSTSAKKAQASPKDQSQGQAKGKGKGKSQMEQALSAKSQNPKERKDSHGQCVQYGKNSDGIQNQGGGSIEPIFPKEIYLVKLVTFLNQPDYNSTSLITGQLSELKLQVQNLEHSTGQNAALFQEQSEKSDKARLELKEDIQSSINNISLKNELPRQSTPILDRNVLDDLHHTILGNEVETACNFKDIPKLGEWPTFNGEGEYNYMYFMKTIDMFKEDFDIPDEYISARLHSLFTRSAKKWY